MNANAEITKGTGSRSQGDAAFDWWLQASLKRAYDGADLEPVPDDLLALCGEPAARTADAVAA